MFITNNEERIALSKESTNLINDYSKDKELIDLKKQEFKNSIVLNNRNYDYKISNPYYTDLRDGNLVYICCGWLCNLGNKKAEIDIDKIKNKAVMGNISKMINLQGHDCVNNLQSIEHRWGVSSGHYVLPINMFKIELINSEDCILIEYNKFREIFSFYYYYDDFNISNFVYDIQID